MSYISPDEIARTRAAIADLWGSTLIKMAFIELQGSSGAPKTAYAEDGTFPCSGVAPIAGETSLIPDAMLDSTQYYCSVPPDIDLLPEDRVVIDGVPYVIEDDPGAAAPDALGRRLRLSTLK